MIYVGQRSNCCLSVIGCIVIDNDKEYELKHHRFTISKEGYAICTKCHIPIHRIVIGDVNSKLEVDHINRQKLDNRLKNIRLVTRSQNARNILRRGNKRIPISGVWLHGNVWVAESYHLNKKTIISRNRDLHDAVMSKIRYEIENYGEFAPDYKSILRNTPDKYLLSWFPEIYGKDNISFIDDQFLKKFFFHNKEKNDRVAMRYKLNRYRKKY